MPKTKRGDEIPRPNPWILRPHNTQAAKGWDELRRNALEALDRAWVEITGSPRSAVNPARHHRLRFTLQSVKIDGRELEQWQYEVTSGGRIWYAVDDENRTLWLTKAEPGHPAITDKGKRGGRRLR